MYQNPSSSFTGTWNAVYTGSDTLDLPAQFTFTTSDNNVISSNNPSITGTVDSAGGISNISFYLTSTNGYVYVFTGALNSDGSISGTWKNSNRESGTWRAARSS